MLDEDYWRYPCILYNTMRGRRWSFINVCACVNNAKTVKRPDTEKLFYLEKIRVEMFVSFITRKESNFERRKIFRIRLRTPNLVVFKFIFKIQAFPCCESGQSIQKVLHLINGGRTGIDIQ